MAVTQSRPSDRMTKMRRHPYIVVIVELPKHTSRKVGRNFARGIVGLLTVSGCGYRFSKRSVKIELHC